MGRGLKIKSVGTHMAFTAGTGIIVFMDLVGYLIRRNLKMIKPEKDFLTDKFKLVLFASFKNKEMQIGAKLCKAL
jgi:hypothetical protein